MSRLQVANVRFESTGANRMDYVGGNVNIVTANTVISNRLVSNTVYANTYYDSANTSYYIDPAGTSVANNVRYTSMGIGNVTYVSNSGHNNMMMVINGKLFTTCGTAATWFNSQTGRGLTATTSIYGLNNFKLVNFPGETGTLTQVGHCGYGHSYALFSTGNLYTWGTNTTGSCGLGTTTAVGLPTLANTGVSQVFDTIAPSETDNSYGRLFIKRTDGFVYVTGYNGYGQLGVGDTTQRTSFTKVPLGAANDIRAVWPIGTQYGHTFFEMASGGLYGAGYNAQGQLGINGNTTNQSTPVALTGWGTSAAGRYIKKVIGGSSFNNTTATTSRGWSGILYDNGTTTEFYLSGNNTEGQMGDTTKTNRSLPASPSVGSGRIADIGATGSIGTVFLLKENGDLWVWGYNGYGQLGNGTTTDNATPALLTSNVTAIYCYPAGGTVQQYVTAVFYQKSTGLYTAGYNAYGQCGVGDTTDNSTFTQVLLPADFTVSKLGSYSSNYPTTTFLAVGTDGRLYGWGYNAQTNITTETTTNCLAPIQITLPIGA